MGTLKTFQKRCCERLLEKLYVLNLEVGRVDEFRDVLEEIHTAFLGLREACLYTQPKNVEVEFVRTRGDVREYQVGKMVVFTDLSADQRILGMSDEFAELESVFVGLKLKEAKEMANQYSDYENRKCNICGEYFTLPNYSAPLRRIKLSDCVLAAHQECMDSNRLFGYFLEKYKKMNEKV